MSTLLRHNVIIRSQAEGAREAERQRIAARFSRWPSAKFHQFPDAPGDYQEAAGARRGSGHRRTAPAQDLCRSQVAELRSFVRSMRPADEGMSLTASLSRMVDRSSATPASPRLSSPASFTIPPRLEVSLELLQIVRETLNNIQKHSGATRVAVSAARATPESRSRWKTTARGFHSAEVLRWTSWSCCAWGR